MKKIISLFLGFIITTSVISVNADDSSTTPEYEYFMNTAEGSAYVMLGNSVEESGMEFLDGQKMGITDNTNKYYNETVVLDGLAARKQYNANSMYFKVNDEFYEEGDNDILISIVYYDFGPTEGTYYFEYHSTAGTIEQVKLIKPGTNPGWAVKTVVLDDIDLSATYDDGSTIRIQNGAYNAFKKIEMVNISKSRRENKNVDMTALSLYEIRREMDSLLMMDANDLRFADDNSAKPCSLYDVNELKNKITNNDATVSASLKSVTLTQGELLTSFMNICGLKKEDNESAVQAASRYGIAGTGFFTTDDAPATYFNLLHIAYQVLIYNGTEYPVSLLEQLITGGFYDNADTASIESDPFQSLFYKNPKYMPYETITDPITGRSYNFMSIGGAKTFRGYNNVVGWLPDGSGFICGLVSADFFLYDINTQMLTYLDRSISNSVHLPVYVNVDGWAYYPKRENGRDAIYKINPRTGEKQHLFTLPEGMKAGYFEVTNDGRYIALDTQQIGASKNEDGEWPIIRLDLQEQKMEYHWYGFSYSNVLNHNQINPTNPDIIGFSHETDTANYAYEEMIDRANVIDMETGEIVKYNQGIKGDGGGAQLVTHEVWSYDGDYRYFCSYGGRTVEDGEVFPAFVRTAPDYTHRQYYAINMPYGIANHGNVSGDDKWAMVDGGWISLINLETHQTFPVASVGPVLGSANHPYHPHAHLSYTGNMANWGHLYGDTLGVAWMDLTPIMENEVAKGGRYPYNDYVTRVSYEGLECESSVETKYGRECMVARAGKSIFLDALPKETDDNNVAVKITFDYYDNTRSPIVITYSRGVAQRNDALKSYDKSTELVRTDTNEWKTAEIILNSANFEDMGKFTTDFKLTSGGMNLYISDVKVELIKNNGSKW